MCTCMNGCGHAPVCNVFTNKENTPANKSTKQTNKLKWANNSQFIKHFFLQSSLSSNQISEVQNKDTL